MDIRRGEIWWADLPEPVGSGPGHRRPVLVVQSDGNVRLLDAPGNVLIPAQSSGLPRDSVANVTQVLTVNRDLLTERVHGVSASIVTQVNEGLRFALDL
jgi:mRNA interferase MazF